MIHEFFNILEKSSFWLGLIVLGVLLTVAIIKHPSIPKLRTVLAGLLLYVYMWYIFNVIVGTPLLSEWRSMHAKGISIFNPKFNFKILAYGLNNEIFLNIAMFAPIGFLAACVSRHYENILVDVIFGFGVSALIELSQMFTLLRATDIDDLITNTLGGLIGYIVYRLMLIFADKKHKKGKHKSDGFIYCHYPVFIVIAAFICTFIGDF